ncbi:MAG: hypothetical protein ACPG19_00090 [Saprospiraceae bacterium]
MKKIIFFLIFSSLTIFSFAQNSSIQFNYKGVSYDFLTFEKIGCTVNQDDISINIREKPLAPEGIKDWKKGKRINLEIHQFPVRLPIYSVDSFYLDQTSFQEGERQSSFSKDKTSARQTKQMRLQNSVKDREARLEKLNKRLKKGDITAMAELEGLTEATNNEFNGLEDVFETNPFEDVNYFGLTLYLPIEDGQKEQEIRLLSGKIYIETLSPKMMILRFEGDTETDSLHKTDDKNLKETGFTIGKIKVYFNQYKDERVIKN